jgi:hypothetical protein
MNPEVMINDVRIVTIAHIQRLCRAGRMKGTASRKRKPLEAMEPQ